MPKRTDLQGILILGSGRNHHRPGSTTAALEL
jgi:hypothetical protein